MGSVRTGYIKWFSSCVQHNALHRRKCVDKGRGLHFCAGCRIQERPTSCRERDGKNGLRCNSVQVIDLQCPCNWSLVGVRDGEVDITWCGRVMAVEGIDGHSGCSAWIGGPALASTVWITYPNFGHSGLVPCVLVWVIHLAKALHRLLIVQ